MRLIIFALILVISSFSFATIILQESFNNQNPFPPTGWTKIFKMYGYDPGGWAWSTGGYAHGFLTMMYGGNAITELRTPIFINTYGELIHLSFKYTTTTSFLGFPHASHDYKFIVYKNQNDVLSVSFPDDSPWTTFEQTLHCEQNAEYFFGFRLDKPYPVESFVDMSLLIDDVLIESVGSNLVPVETATLGNIKAIYR